MQIYDIDNDLPENDQIKITVNGKKYIVPLVVSYGLGCYLLNNKEILAEIFSAGNGRPSLSLKTLDFAYNVALELLKEQDPEILTDEYLKKHLSVTKLIIMLIKMTKPFLEYMTKYGNTLIGSTTTEDTSKTKKK